MRAVSSVPVRRAAQPRVASEGRRRRACAWEGRAAARASRSAEGRGRDTRSSLPFRARRRFRKSPSLLARGIRREATTRKLMSDAPSRLIYYRAIYMWDVHVANTPLGGGEVVFYLGRHALKTYVCVQESSSCAMCGLAWTKTLLDKN